MATTLEASCRTEEGESQTQEPAGQPQTRRRISASSSASHAAIRRHHNSNGR